ncbi:MAG: UvrD-helicase domain-containing protein [Actinomycetota bacterium]|nr:UvrD-helicase domain-containing protein [Actinomycetota bacterium]
MGRDISYLENLNSSQKEAVLHESGPLLIIAGAGSGKTRALTHRIAHLVVGLGVKPSEILAVTFTNKAAREMKERLDNLGVRSSQMMIGTFHSCCARILRREITKLGYTTNFNIYDEADSKRLIARCIDELELSRKQFPPGALRASISRAKSEMIDTDTYAKSDLDFFREVVLKVYRMYQEKLRSNDALDFDDLLYVTVNLFELYPDVLESYQMRFRHVFVDEYQDTNLVQYRLTKLLAEKHRNICVVGDDDQGIYSWRGADIRNILEFEKDYPNARIVKLEQNYRSTPEILSAAGAVIEHNASRKEKTLWTKNSPGDKVRHILVDDEHGEASFLSDFVRGYVEEKRGNYGDIAVFYRVHAQSRIIEEEFIRNGIPYRIFGGTRFYERQEIRDILSYLRVIANPRDELSLRRILNVPPRGIGKTTLHRLERYSMENGLSLYDSLGMADDISALSPRAKANIKGLHELMENLREYSEEREAANLIEEVLERTGYMELLRNGGTIEAESCIENLNELLNVARDFAVNFGAVSLGDFLERVSLIDDTQDLDEKAGYVSLLTLHNAKGLEFPAVAIIGVEEGLIPHARSMDYSEEIEEERRLLYVGMTRAKELLLLLSAAFRSVRGRLEANQNSRFLEEIPEGFVEIEDKAEIPFDLGTIELEEGDKIIHKKWGEGTVVSLENLPDDIEITAQFQTVGLKRLLLSYAPITKVT